MKIIKSFIVITLTFFLLSSFGCSKNVKPGEILWTIKTDDTSHIVSADKQALYYGTDFKLYGVNKFNKSNKWSIDILDQIPDRVREYRGSLYYQSGESLISLNKVTGKINWRFKTGYESVFSIWATKNFLVIDPGNSIVSINTKTGKEQWRYKKRGSVEYHLSAVSGKLVYMFLVQEKEAKIELLAADVATGKEIAKTKFMATEYPYPLIIKDGFGFFQIENEVIAMNLKSGKQMWKYEFTEFFSGDGEPGLLKADKDQVYIANFDDLFVLDLKNGTLKWQFHTNQGNHQDYIASAQNIIIANEMVYAVVPSKLSGDSIFALDSATGKTKWMFSKEKQSFNLFDISRGKLFALGQPQGKKQKTILYALDAQFGKIKWKKTIANQALSEFQFVANNGIGYYSQGFEDPDYEGDDSLPPPITSGNINAIKL